MNGRRSRPFWQKLRTSGPHRPPPDSSCAANSVTGFTCREACDGSIGEGLQCWHRLSQLEKSQISEAQLVPLQPAAPGGCVHTKEPFPAPFHHNLPSQLWHAVHTAPNGRALRVSGVPACGAHVGCGRSGDAGGPPYPLGSPDMSGYKYRCATGRCRSPAADAAAGHAQMQLVRS